MARGVKAKGPANPGFHLSDAKVLSDQIIKQLRTIAVGHLVWDKRTLGAAREKWVAKPVEDTTMLGNRPSFVINSNHPEFRATLQVDIEASAGNRFLMQVLIHLYHSPVQKEKEGAPLLLVRAEWDFREGASLIHAQPHWHFQLQADSEPADAQGSSAALEQPETFEQFMAASEVQASVAHPGSNFHLAMGASWHQKTHGTHSVVLTDGEDLARWMAGVLRYLRSQVERVELA